MLALSGSALAGPVYNLDWMNGTEPRSGSFAIGGQDNKVYVIEAWFNGCPYCHENAPQVEALAASLKANPNIVVVDLGRDRRDSDYASWISRHNPNHPVVRDGLGDSSLIKSLEVKLYPTTVVLDCNLVPKFRTEGEWQEGDQAKIAEQALAIAAQPCQVAL